MTDNNHNITPALHDNAVPIDSPVLHPGNYRQGDVEMIASSLARFGQVRPIVVQNSTGNVVAGNHTLKAARSLGWSHIAVVVVDMDDAEAEAYLVADNRASDKATNDDAALGAVLERLMLAGRLEGTGWSPDQVDDLMSALDALPQVDPPPTEAGHAVDDTELAQRFANRSQVALRQFVIMYDQGTATGVEQLFRGLERKWGMSQARDVVLEALKRAATAEGVEFEIVPAVAAPAEDVAAVAGAAQPPAGSMGDADATAMDQVDPPPEEGAANLDGAAGGSEPVEASDAS